MVSRLQILASIAILLLAKGSGSGAADTNGCSDYSQDDGTCMCHRTCWELSSDELTCMPVVNTTFVDDHLEVTVPKCATDGFLSLGGYSETDDIPAECQYTEAGNQYVFNVEAGECGTTIDNTTDETRYRATLSIWIEDPHADEPDPLISRDGKWYHVESFTTSERSFTVSESFSPVNNNQNVSLTAEDPFAPATLRFDFFKTDAFAEAYEQADYPIEYTLGDDVYYALTVETTDTDLELFTTSCTAEPSPNPNDISSYVLRDQGCNQDTTVIEHISNDPLVNHFSVSAFQFKESLEGITGSTDVTIQCTAVVCVSNMASSTCSKGCQTVSTAKRSIYKRSAVVINEIKAQEEENAITEQGPQTVRSPPIHIGNGAVMMTTNLFVMLVTAFVTFKFL